MHYDQIAFFPGETQDHFQSYGVLPVTTSPTTGRGGPSSRSERQRRDVIFLRGTATTRLSNGASEARPARVIR